METKELGKGREELEEGREELERERLAFTEVAMQLGRERADLEVCVSFLFVYRRDNSLCGGSAAESDAD